MVANGKWWVIKKNSRFKNNYLELWLWLSKIWNWCINAIPSSQGSKFSLCLCWEKSLPGMLRLGNLLLITVSQASTWLTKGQPPKYNVIWREEFSSVGNMKLDHRLSWQLYYVNLQQHYTLVHTKQGTAMSCIETQSAGTMLNTLVLSFWCRVWIQAQDRRVLPNAWAQKVGVSGSGFYHQLCFQSQLCFRLAQGACHITSLTQCCHLENEGLPNLQEALWVLNNLRLHSKLLRW